MSKMSLESFREEDDIIKREISSGGGFQSGNVQRSRISEERDRRQNSGRRTIRIDEIEVVGGKGNARQGFNLNLISTLTTADGSLRQYKKTVVSRINPSLLLKINLQDA